MDNGQGWVTMVRQFFGVIDKCNSEESSQPNQKATSSGTQKEKQVGDVEENTHEQYAEEAGDELESNATDDGNVSDNIKAEDLEDCHYYRKKVLENYNSVIDQMKHIIQSQQILNKSIDQLRDNTVELGNSAKLFVIYDGVMKLITLWKLVNCSSEEIAEYYSELLYETFTCFGLVAIIPQPGELYSPELHQKENASSTSNIIISCEKYNWGWKTDDVILKKAIVVTASNEDFENGSNL